MTETTGEGHEVGARFIGSVQRYAAGRITDELEERLRCEEDLVNTLGPLYALVARHVVVETLHQLEQDGFCSFGFHCSPFEPTEKGVCEWCEKPLAEHELMPVCRREAKTLQGKERASNAERLPGFYWLRIDGGEAMVGEWSLSSQSWLLPGRRHLASHSVQVISERLLTPGGLK